MTKQNQIHVLADETLGGTLREYVEVERKAEVGDYVHISEYADEPEDFIGKIDCIDSFGDFITYGKPFDRSGDRRDLTDDCDVFRTLEPTDIVHISLADDDDDVSATFRCRLVDRKAEVGERVIISTDDDDFVNGSILTVSEEDRWDDGSGISVKEEMNGLFHDEYRVLEPVEAPQSIPDKPETYDDIIANLVARVSQAERDMLELIEIVQKDRRNILDKIDVVKDDIETWAQEHEKTKRELDDKFEMCIDDIVTLDERTSTTEECTEHVNTRRCCGCQSR